MANLFIEGFDNYPNGGSGFGQTGNPWVVTGTNSNNMISTTTGMTGLRCGYWPSSNATNSGDFRPFPSSSEVYVGFAVIVQAFNAPVGQTMIGIRASTWCGFQTTVSGYPQFMRGSTVLAQGTTPLLSGVKYYIEMHLTNTTYELRIDGVVTLSGTMSSVTGYNAFGCTRAFNGAGGAFFFDDIYVNDATGTINNGYLGEISVLTIYPTADLTPMAWVPSVGTTAWAILDNAPSTTDVVTGNLAGDKMRVDFSALGVAVTDIHTVVASTRMAKTTSGANTTVVRLENQGTQLAGANHAPAQTTMAWYFDQFPLDPATGLPWDPATFAPKVEIERTV